MAIAVELHVRWAELSCVLLSHVHGELHAGANMIALKNLQVLLLEYKLVSLERHSLRDKAADFAEGKHLHHYVDKEADKNDAAHAPGELCAKVALRTVFDVQRQADHT